MGNWNNEAREVDLVKNVLIGGEGVCSLGDTIGKITPADGSRKVKKDRGNVPSGDFGNPAEHEDKHQALKQGLEKIPEGSQDRLLVLRDKIAMGQ